MKDNKKDLISDDISQDIIDITETLVKNDGPENVTVRKVLSVLGTTNRVFYNRFHNLEEVLLLVYEKSVVKMRKSIKEAYNEEKDFFEYIMDVAVNILLDTYNIKMQFSNYMFQHDSFSEENRTWWTAEIKKLFTYAVENNLIKKVDVDVFSYAIWCFCRGYNADVVTRRVSKEEAVKNFRLCFGCFLDGLRK